MTIVYQYKQTFGPNGKTNACILEHCEVDLPWAVQENLWECSVQAKNVVVSFAEVSNPIQDIK